MTKIRLLSSIAVLALALGLLMWQRGAVRQLQAENQALRRSADELQTLREENARLAKERTDPAELERLRSGQSELIRLRGQVAQLRRQAAEAASKRPALKPETPPATATDASAPQIDTFIATARAVVPWKQTLITGGWASSPGKRTLVFIQPEEESGSVTLQTRFIDVPELVLSQLGLDGVKVDEKQSSTSALLTIEQTETAIKALEKMEGVDVLSAPRVITADGRQAQVKVVDVKTAPSGEQYELGPTINLTPKISDDRTAVQLNVKAQLRLPTAPAK